MESANACYYSVQNLLSSSLLSNNIKIKVHRTIILSFALYGCETWSLTLREEHRVRVFDNRVLKRVVGPWRDEETGEWRRLQNESLLSVLHTKYYSGGQIKKKRWSGHVEYIYTHKHTHTHTHTYKHTYIHTYIHTYVWERRHIYSVLVGKPEGKRPLGRHRHRWKENIKRNLKEMVW